MYRVDVTPWAGMSSLHGGAEPLEGRASELPAVYMELGDCGVGGCGHGRVWPWEGVAMGGCGGHGRVSWPWEGVVAMGGCGHGRVWWLWEGVVAMGKGVVGCGRCDGVCGQSELYHCVPHVPIYG